MAPFGKNFLKTRLKSRTRDAEVPVVGKEIQVTVCEEEKVVCGVTKHTTCADLVQALLEDHRAVGPESRRLLEDHRAVPESRRLLEDHRAVPESRRLLEDHRAVPESRRPLLHGDPADFCLLERWKGFERALPPLTRILRLWNAWGDQKPFIQFVLVKTSDFVAQPAAAGGKKVAAGSSKAPPGTRPKRWGEHHHHQQQQQQQHQGPAALQFSSQSLPVERQKRMVKKAFRKLEKLHKEKSPSSQGTEDIDRMVQLILTQDHSIRGQIQRMRQLDLDIQRLELQAEAGAVVGPCSVLEAGCSPSCSSSSSSSEEQQQLMMMQEFVYTSDGVVRLDEQVHRHQALILQLSRDIDAELRSRADDFAWTTPEEEEEEEEEEEGRRGGEGDASECGAAAAASSSSSEEAENLSLVYGAELERLQQEMRRSLFSGISLYAQTTELDKELTRYEASLVSKDQECWQLAAQLRALQLEDGSVEEKSGPVVAPKGHHHHHQVQQQQCGGGLSQTLKLKSSPPTADVTDTDSDTGISSTHSQDSLSPCLDFPPPLDTDV